MGAFGQTSNTFGLALRGDRFILRHDHAMAAGAGPVRVW